jgi:crotonobetainyl-CoA:carnitine CoA-transferase CaiB-like acyl-CoA transferase
MNEPPPVRPRAPLDGYRILDFTERLQGPLGTQTLGDLGADIVKVERIEVTTPEGNPSERYRRATHGSGYDLDLYTAAFLSLNRNKRSIALDLKSEAGLAVARRLVGVCDVVYENFRPGVMDRLGLGYADCATIKPAVVYASASGYGPDGPYANRRGQDILAQAIGGLAMMNAPAGGRPLAVGIPIADVLGGMNGALAVMAALLYRNRTGEGQQVFVNLLDGVLAAQSEEALLFLNTLAGEPRRRTPAQAHPYIPPPYGLYATRDGYIALPSGQQLSELSAILGIPDMRRDPRFATSQSRNQHRDEFDHLVEEALAGHTTAEWMELMLEADIYAAPVNSAEQAFSDPQVKHNGMVIEVEAPGGPLTMVASPLRFSKTPPQVRNAPPMLGEHTVDILELAGYTTDEIEKMLESGAVAAPSAEQRQKDDP